MIKNYSYKDGFTLVELMVVIVILGILSASAAAKISSISDKAKASEIPSIMAIIGQAETMYHQETNEFIDIPYATWRIDLKLILGVEIEPKLFSYYVTDSDDIAFLARAKVETPFGKITNTSTEVTLDQVNQVSFINDDGTLESYLRSWAH